MSLDSTFAASVAVFLVALALDLAWGEPPGIVHPVVWMGRVASALERVSPRRGLLAQFVAGCFIVILVAVPFSLAAALVMSLVSPMAVVEVAVGAFVLKSMFAWRALGVAGRQVRDFVAAGDVDGARSALRSLCSRDPAGLDAPRVSAAAIESLAENASDSFVAPAFYYALFGVPGAVFYRAVNTLDAMIGYRGRYEYLGKAAARLDDVLNFIPARITAGLLLVAGAFGGGNVRGGWRILLRDGPKTESPNAGRPMAAMAGLLGVELEKVDHYRLGDNARVVTAASIDEAWRFVRIAAVLWSTAVVLVLVIRHGL